MSMYLSAHMTTFKDKAERKFANLTVEITHCVHEGESASTYSPEANMYNRMKLKSTDENVDVTFYVQPEHLYAMHAALGEFIEHLAEYEARGDSTNVWSDVIKRSADFAPPKPEPEPDMSEEEKARIEAAQAHDAVTS